MVDINKVAENIYMIDEQLFSVPEWGSAYLIDEERKALIDAGVTTSAETLLGGVRRAGVRPEDIDYLIITHIHLDHAGGAGFLIKSMPKAKVLVHHKGARDMVDPAEMLSRYLRTRGAEAMARYGEVVPIEEHRVQSMYDGDEVELGDKQVLKFIDAPGHAPHELCIYESRNGGLFIGDAAGMYVANKVSLPISPAPGFDAELYINTLQRLMKLDTTRLYFGHFGASGRVQENLRLAIDKLQAWGDIATEAIKKKTFDGIADRIMAQGYAELEPVRRKQLLYTYLTEVIMPMNVAGYIRYLREKHQDELN